MEQEPGRSEEVIRLFGPIVEADLRERNIILERTLTGGLLIPKGNGFMLEEYRHLFKKKLSKKNAPPRIDKYAILEQQVLKCKPEDYDLDDEDNFDLFVNFRRTLDLSSKNVPASSLTGISESSDVIMTEVKPTLIKKEQNETQIEIADYINYCNYVNFGSNLFTKDLNTADKFREFMGPDSKKYDSCLPLIAPIYKRFLMRHKRFGYKYILKNIPQDKSSMDGQISQHQLKEYFRKIFWAVVPVDLFGNKQNVKKIRKMVNKYFQTAFGEYFSPQTVVNQLNISSVEWLRVIEDEDTKMSIMSQLVESFFEKYIMAVLGTYIYTEKMTWSNEKIFFRLDHWIYCSKNYIEQQKANGVYREIGKEKLKNMRPSDIPDAKLILHIKKNGIRPIILTRPTPTQKREASILNRLLYQMFLKKFELVTPQKLENLWRSIHETCTGNADRPLYFVSCDINDAFGSIDLRKLLDIVLAMMDELDDKLTLQKFAIFNPRLRITRYFQREYFDTPSLPLALPARTLSCRNTEERSTIIDKEWLKRRMRSYILHRKISINSKLHYQMKGIGQGVPLSSLLSEIYYGTMVVEQLGDFMSSGYLLRYVDDFLYFTQDRTSAERFLEQVHKGIATYNCSFNTKKTSSNLPPYFADEFVYLGYRFNVNHFDVTPEYPDVPVRYTINLSWPDPANALSVFTKRLAHSQCLKVDKIVLDPSMNSKKAIKKTIDLITMMSAKRCFALLLSMVDSKIVPAARIFDIIKNYSVDRLCLRISKLCFPTSDRHKEEIESLKKSIWKVYFKTFRGKADSFKPLTRRMRYQWR